MIKKVPTSAWVFRFVHPNCSSTSPLSPTSGSIAVLHRNIDFPRKLFHNLDVFVSSWVSAFLPEVSSSSTSRADILVSYRDSFVAALSDIRF